MTYNSYQLMVRALLALALSVALLACASAPEVAPEATADAPNVEAGSASASTDKGTAGAAEKKLPKTTRAYVQRFDSYEEFADCSDCACANWKL